MHSNLTASRREHLYSYYVAKKRWKCTKQIPAHVRLSQIQFHDPETCNEHGTKDIDPELKVMLH